MSQLTGESADKWNTEFEKMGDGVSKFAVEYQAHYHQLTTAQLEYIQKLEDQGQKEQAEYALAKDVYEYLGSQAPEKLGVLESAWRGLGNVVSSVWDGMKAVGRNSNADQVAQVTRAMNNLKEQRANAPTGTGEANFLDRAIAGYQKQLDVLNQAEAAEQKKTQATADGAKVQTEGVAAAAKLHEQFEASKTSGEKLKQTLAEINDELAKAVAGDPGNKAFYEKEAAGARSQAMKSDTPHAPKAKNDEVQILEQGLQTQLENEKSYFGDSKAEELKYWTDSLAQTNLGAEQKRAIKTKIYDLDRDLAHQSYDDQLSVLNDQLEADRDNWSRTQSDWAAKLAFIKSAYGDQSSEYHNAHREEEAAERQHQAQMSQIQREGEQRALDQLKDALATAKTLRDNDARTQESLINANASSSPVGEIQAAIQIAQLHKQLNAQDLADAQSTYMAEDALREQSAARAYASYGIDSTQYQTAINAKLTADQQYQNKRRVMQDQATQQSIRDAQEIQSKWMGVTQPIGSAFSSMFQSMYNRQATFGQAAAQEGDKLLFKFVDVVEQDVEKWGAAQLAKTGIIHAQSAAQAAAQTTAATTAAVAQKAVDVATVTGYAGEAAAATFAAYSPMALIAPGLPEGMASAAFAQTMSFGSFDVGTNVVPRDMIAQIHAGERIVPAADNRALMNAVSGGGSSAGGGGAPTFHQAFEQHFHGGAHDPRAMASELAPHMMDLFESMHRRGMFKK